MWAVVLVPMWLRRHDATTESRSVDRFSTAMRVLSRRNRQAPLDRRYVLVPPKTSARVSAHVSGASAPRPNAAASTRPATRPASRPAGRPPGRTTARPTGRAALLARRRRMLLILGGLASVTFVLAVAGVLIGWSGQFVVDVLLVAYAAHLRSEARRAAAVPRQRRRVTVATAPSAGPLSTYADPLPAAEPVAEGEPVPAYDAGVEGTGTDGYWEPVPVPPPTYTLKPPAPPRLEPLFDQEEFEQVAEDEAPEIDEILERRRAVND